MDIKQFLKKSLRQSLLSQATNHYPSKHEDSFLTNSIQINDEFIKTIEGQQLVEKINRSQNRIIPNDLKLLNKGAMD